MKYVRMIAMGLVLWSLTLVWPEINLVRLPAAGLTWALMGLVGLYLLLVRRGITPPSPAAAYVHNDSLHHRPTRPYPVRAARKRDSRPTRPLPQL